MLERAPLPVRKSLYTLKARSSDVQSQKKPRLPSATFFLVSPGMRWMHAMSRTFYSIPVSMDDCRKGWCGGVWGMGMGGGFTIAIGRMLPQGTWPFLAS